MSPARRKPEVATTTCPWCSATIPVDVATCPSCGAAVKETADAEVAGVTQVDPTAASMLSRIKPNRLTRWLGADTTVAPTELGGRIEAPSEEVRREMLKMELAAIDAEIEAKNNQIAAERDLAVDDGKPAPG